MNTYVPGRLRTTAQSTISTSTGFTKEPTATDITPADVPVPGNNRAYFLRLREYHAAHRLITHTPITRWGLHGATADSQGKSVVQMGAMEIMDQKGTGR